jgi:anti-sigma regulatory factor (Ser/Thr protein kinase)
VEGLRKPPSLHLRLQTKEESALVLRERLGLWLDELGASSEELYDISLAASEAFVNAVEHPQEPSADVIEVDGSIRDHTILIVIHDFGSWRDKRQREEGGYGFPLMRTLMDAVDVETASEGTAITLRRRIRSQW